MNVMPFFGRAAAKHGVDREPFFFINGSLCPLAKFARTAKLLIMGAMQLGSTV